MEGEFKLFPKQKIYLLQVNFLFGERVCSREKFELTLQVNFLFLGVMF
jgi:hypothetical protein